MTSSSHSDPVSDRFLRESLELFQKNDFAGAAREAQKVLLGGPRLSSEQEYRGLCLYGASLAVLDRPLEAIVFLEEALQLCQDDPFPYQYLGTANHRLLRTTPDDKERIALKENIFYNFETAHNLDPGSAITISSLCAFYREEGLNEDALPLAQKLMKSAPDHAPYAENCADVLMALERFDEAEILFKQAGKLGADPRAVYESLSGLHRCKFDFRRALHYGEMASVIAEAEGDLQGAQKLSATSGIFLFQLGEHEESESRLRDGARDFPEDGEIASCYGRLLSMQKKYSAARPYLLKAVELNPEDYNALYHYALICKKQGDDLDVVAELAAIGHQLAMQSRDPAAMYDFIKLKSPGDKNSFPIPDFDF